MKNWILLTCLLSCGFLLQAQSEREELVDVLAEETCLCLDEKSPDELSAGNLEMTVGLCILNAFTVHGDDYPGVDLDLSDPSAMEELGEEIGFRMFNYCPGLLMRLATEGGFDDASQGDYDMIAPPPPPPPAIQMTGTLERIAGKELAQVVIQTSGGTRESFVWLENFPGSHILLGDKEEWTGRSVTVYANEVSIYNPTKGSYTTYRKIVELILLD